MINVAEIYLIIMLLLHPIDEIYTCNNPNLIDMNQHLLCNWTYEDFEKKQGKLILKKQRDVDNVIKAYYRKKYWEKKDE